MIEKRSGCKVNLVLNVLGLRSDGYHELETLMLPLPVFDRIRADRGGDGVQLTCSDPGLPVDENNVVWRAARAFLDQVPDVGASGVKLHLEKRIPYEAGLGGGSGNAATTLLALNELFEHPLTHGTLCRLAEGLGSDVPFFLEEGPALATGRGEKIQRLAPFGVLRGLSVVLAHPGFGIRTGWAYRQLRQHPTALERKPGLAGRVAHLLEEGRLEEALPAFYNCFELPAFFKFPLLPLLKEFLQEQGAQATLMTGSGAAVFGLIPSDRVPTDLIDRVKSYFGRPTWVAVAEL